ncbi:MAG: DUF1592 domain-containing protein [Mariniblastus sp.]
MKFRSRIQFQVCVLAFPLAVLLQAAVASLPVSADDKNDLGKNAYITKCASCHGASGEGNKDYFEDPLRGDLSLSELTKYISETMPEEDPDACVAKEADAVAKYVFENFYSAAAQKRLNAARIELSRLTVRQYRESVADLIGTFNRPFSVPKERGIRAKYFASRNPTKEKMLSEQIDATVDFGEAVPHFQPTGKYENIKKEKDPKKDVNLMNQGFSAYWEGGVIPPETGTYEFIVESKNGFQLFVNNLETPLIDRDVRSDDVVEHKGLIYLLAGRPFSLKLKMFSYPKPPAKIRLLWRLPNGRKSVIPKSALIQNYSAEVAVVSTAFPADDASYGYERGVSVSRQWDTATTEAAIQTANYVAERIWKLAKTKPDKEDKIEKIKWFCHQFVARAFAKQLTDEDRQFFVDQHFEKEISIEDQVKRVVIMTLKSPRFLYPAIQQRDRDHELARRMSLSLWDSVPDATLIRLAEKGQLKDKKVTERELYRMVNDSRSHEKLHSFFHYWLKADHGANVTKDKDAFPDFDDAIVSDLKTSLDLYLDEVIWNEKSDFRELFLADYLYVNPRLAKFYGLESEEDGFQKVSVDPKKRAGILTHPYLMTGLAYHKDSSPIHRGVFVAKQLLGRRLRQPPNDVKPLTEEFDPKMTTRQRVEHQTKETGCMNCHTVINPLGFSLENFDAVGRFRTEERQKPIEVSTVYKTPNGKKVELNGARDLAEFLATNEMAQRSFIRQLFQHYAKQSIDAYGADQLDRLHNRFVEVDFNVRQMLVEIALVIIDKE